MRSRNKRHRQASGSRQLRFTAMMNTSIFKRPIISAALLFGLTGLSCEPQLEPRPSFSRLFITDVQGLEAPKVSQAELFKPDIQVAVDPNDPESPRAAGFMVTIATANPQQTAIRLNDAVAGTTQTLINVAGPDLAFEGNLQSYLRSLSDEAARMLKSGIGVFWLIDSGLASDTLASRVAVLLPADVLSSRMEIEIYTDTGSSDTPVGGDRIELARGFFYMAVFGDSVMTGNGLPEDLFYSRLIRDEIEKRTGLRVVLQDRALGGSRVVPTPGEPTCPEGCNGQLSFAFTSVTRQVDLVDAPESIDFVLLNGCLNDISFRTIIDPDTEPEALEEMADTSCGIEVEKLLDKVRTLMPSAYVVFTGYYPVLSEESRLIELTDWAAILEEEPNQIELLEAGLAELAAQSEAFDRASKEALQSAIDATNAKEADRAPRFAYAHPDFEPSNALQADESFLWGLGPLQTRDLAFLQDLIPPDIQLFPQDMTFIWRVTACASPGVLDPYPLCLYNTIGHPNVEGSIRYAEKIDLALERLGFWKAFTPEN